MADKIVNPKQTGNKNSKEDDVLSKKTKTSCEDDVLNLVDEEIESLSKRKGKKSLLLFSSDLRFFSWGFIMIFIIFIIIIFIIII
jgi:hypothetical protein